MFRQVVVKVFKLLHLYDAVKNCIYKGRRFLKSFLVYLYNYVLTFVPILALRIFYLRNFLNIKIGQDCHIGLGTYMLGDISLGRSCVVGTRCHIVGPLVVGDNVAIIAHTYIFGTSHYKDSQTFEPFERTVVIDSYAWLGARSMVLPGCHIGEGAVLGAASVATKDLPPFSVAVGAPARVVAKRSSQLEYNFSDYKPYFV